MKSNRLVRLLAIVLRSECVRLGSVAGQTLPELHTLAEVRALTAEQATRHYPVKLRGVITFFNQPLYSRFFQDDTAGIYLGDYANLVTLPPGQVVEVVGTTSPGEYAPIVSPETVTAVGMADLP